MRCDGSHPELDMATEECMGPFPKGWPSCPEIFAGWGTGGGVSKAFADYVFLLSFEIIKDILKNHKLITKTRPCNIQRFFTAVKMTIFS